MPEDEEFDAIPDKPKSKAKKRGRKSLPAHLPRKRVEHDLPESETGCGCCHGELHRMDEETSKQLDIIPATPPLLRPRAS